MRLTAGARRKLQNDSCPNPGAARISREEFRPMIRTTRSALGALGAAFLLAMLVFLFVKTAGIDFKHESSALTLLREMKDFDIHWDDDAARISNDFRSATAPQADFGAMMGRILHEIERLATRDSLRRE